MTRRVHPGDAASNHLLHIGTAPGCRSHCVGRWQCHFATSSNPTMSNPGLSPVFRLENADVPSIGFADDAIEVFDVRMNLLAYINIAAIQSLTVPLHRASRVFGNLCR